MVFLKRKQHNLWVKIIGYGQDAVGRSCAHFFIYMGRPAGPGAPARMRKGRVRELHPRKLVGLFCTRKLLREC